MNEQIYRRLADADRACGGAPLVWERGKALAQFPVIGPTCFRGERIRSALASEMRLASRSGQDGRTDRRFTGGISRQTFHDSKGKGAGMKEIFVLVEHRQGELQDITFELLTGGSEIAGKMDGKVTAILLGSSTDAMAEKMKTRADKILQIEDAKLKDFNAEAYQNVLVSLINEHKPYITLIPQSGFGADLAPSLAVELDLPLTTDCYQIGYEGGKLHAWRQIYGGKVNAKIGFVDSDS